MVVVWGDAAARQQDPKCKHPGRQGPGHSTAKDVASMTHTTSEVLNLAADYIQEHGHLTGRSGDDGGPRCAIGALRSVTGQVPTEETCPSYAALREYLRSSEGDRNGFVGEWNDSHTAAEVIEVLRATAVIEAARESAAVRESVTA